MKKASLFSKLPPIWQSFVALLILIGIMVLGLVVVAAIYLGIGYWEENYPTDADKRFKQACTELDGKEASFEEIGKLEGKCYAWKKGSYEVCQMDEIEKYLVKKPSIYGSERLGGGYMLVYAPDATLDWAWICSVEKTEDKIKASLNYYSN